MVKVIVTFDDNVNEFLINEEGNPEGFDETVDEEVVNVFKMLTDAADAKEFSVKDALDALEHARGNHETMKISLEVVS